MNNLRPVYLLIAVLFIWNLTLSVILNEKNTAVQDEVIVEKNVNGISTDLTKTVDKIKSSCVTVETSSAVSSGFIYQTEEGGAYIITAYHGVADAQMINVTLGNGISVEAQLFGEDVFADIAILYIKTDFKPFPPIILSAITFNSLDVRPKQLLPSLKILTPTASPFILNKADPE